MARFLRNNPLIKQLQVNIPYRMFKDGYLEKFLEYGLNPEIGLDAAALDAVTFSEAEDIAKQFRGTGRTITLHGPFTDLSPGSPDLRILEVTRKRYEQLALLVPLFKPVSVVCHTGYDRKRYLPFREQWMETSLKTWEPLASACQGEGACLVLENVYEKDPSEILPLIENLKDHGVGFCLDIGHQAAFGAASLSRWVQVMAPHLRQLHLHDNGGKWDDHLALGSGTINVEHFFEELRSLSIRPLAVTLEPHREEDLVPSLEYLTPLWPW
jgi:sugar phosphate isomerase/epimerase